MRRSVSIVLVIALLCLIATPVFAAKKQSKKTISLDDVNDQVQAYSYILASFNDGCTNIVAQRNPNEVLYPASLTKVVTAMVTINHVKDLSKSVTVSQEAVDSQRNTGSQIAYLRAGETITYEELLYLSMLFSACDACQVLAEGVAGSVDAFVDMMNSWVKSLGCKNTHFVNPDGLHDDDHYSTAADLLKISSAACNNKSFLKISSAKSFDYNGSTFYHTNRMLHELLDDYYYPYAKGIKTGYTKQAGNCLITLGEKNGMTFLLVILGSNAKKFGDKTLAMSYLDAKELFEWGFSNFELRTVYYKNELVNRMKVVNGKESRYEKLLSKKQVNVIVPVNAKEKDIKTEVLDSPKVLSAPIQEGESILKARITYKDQIIGSTDLVTGNDITATSMNNFAPEFDAYISDKPAAGIIALLLTAFF